MSELRIRPSVGAPEYPVLVEIWRSAVDATHDFLNKDDREEIQGRLPSEDFPSVRLMVAELDGSPVRFFGVLILAGRLAPLLWT